MENEITAKRGFFLILVIATMGIFVALVYLIARNVPWSRINSPVSSIPTSTQRILMNCTYPVGYWQYHPEQYPPQLVMGGKIYQAQDVGGILSGEAQNVNKRLQAQLVTAFLNISSGANQQSIETTIFEAYGWLAQHPEGRQVSDSDLGFGSRLSDTLEAYNLGLAGIAACPGALGYVTETMLPGNMVAFTLTPGETVTVLPSETITPTASETPLMIEYTATYQPVPPTRTPTETEEPPTLQPTKAPTVTKEQPSPTWTKEPTSTFTPPPPPTPTFTLPPFPTDTYTPPPPP